ncbi:hypothetical protein [Hydrogenimonas sp.]
MAGNTRKSTKKAAEAAKPAAEETEALSPLPGMDMAETPSGADAKQDEKADGADGEQGKEDQPSADTETPDTQQAQKEDGADANETQTPDASQEATSDEDEAGSGEPAIYAPNLFMLIYEGDDTYEFREAIRRPFPRLKKGDVVITDRKTAKWLTRTGMPFSIVEDILTIRQDKEVKRTTFIDKVRKMFG